MTKKKKVTFKKGDVVVTIPEGKKAIVYAPSYYSCGKDLVFVRYIEEGSVLGDIIFGGFVKDFVKEGKIKKVSPPKIDLHTYLRRMIIKAHVVGFSME